MWSRFILLQAGIYISVVDQFRFGMDEFATTYDWWGENGECSEELIAKGFLHLLMWVVRCLKAGYINHAINVLEEHIMRLNVSLGKAQHRQRDTFARAQWPGQNGQISAVMVGTEFVSLLNWVVVVLKVGHIDFIINTLEWHILLLLPEFANAEQRLRCNAA